MQANYPFCTIKPQEALAIVADPRLAILAQLEVSHSHVAGSPTNKYPLFVVWQGSEKTVPATFDVVDIAGLIKGASQGEVSDVNESWRLRLSSDT